MLGALELKSCKTSDSINKKNNKQNNITSDCILDEVVSRKKVKQNLQSISAITTQSPITAPEGQNKLYKTLQLEQVVKDTEPKRMPGRIRKRGLNSMSTNPNSVQDDGEQGTISNLQALSTSDIQNTEKESLNKNVVSTSTPKNAAPSGPHSLKTLETYVETMGIDVPSNKYLLAYNRVGKVGLS